MDNFIEFTGGARVGLVNSTFPMAKLKVYADKLELHNGIKVYTFSKEDAKDLKIIKWFPIIAQGIKVNHNKQDVDGNIIFWAPFNLKKVVNGLKDFNWL